MALQKQYTTPERQTGNYWCIRSFSVKANEVIIDNQLVKEEKLTIELLLYRSESAKKQSPFEGPIYSYPLAVLDYVSDDCILDMQSKNNYDIRKYIYLKCHEIQFFSDAIDV